MPIFGPPNIKKLKMRENVPGLIKALEYARNDSVREQAVEALGDLRAKGATEPLLAMLGEDEERPEPGLILNALGKIKDRRAVPALVARVKDRGADACPQELDVLRTIGHPAAVPLIQVLREKTRDARQALILIRILETIGGDSVASGLISLVSPDHPSLIIDLAATLERLGAQGALAPLSNALIAAPEETWAARIAGVLERMGWVPENERDKAALFLARRDWQALESLGAPAVDGLISLLGRVTPSEAARAVDILGRIGDERAVEPLVALLGHKSQDVASKAAHALGQIGHSRNVVEALLQTAADAYSTPVIEAVEHALITIGGKAVPTLLSHLNSGDPRERKTAVRILGEIGDRNALRSLEAARDDPTLQPELNAALEKLGGTHTDPHD